MKEIGNNYKKVGITPSIGLINPKYHHNVGAAVRAASCFGLKQVWYTGNRLELQISKKGKFRLPREERMKSYSEVDLINYDYLLDQFEDKTPVAIELHQGAENIFTFEHPENALYLFGPEDGSIPISWRVKCHRFVFLPTYHCTNLSAAVYLVLYDRKFKRYLEGKEPLLPLEESLKEQRGMYNATFL